MLAVDAIVHALADPIRREILRLLRCQVASAGTIARAFPVSRPAVSRHLRVLRQAGLVRANLCGRERRYVVDLAPLAELEAYLRELRELRGPPQLWQRRFDALETEVQRVRRRRRKAAGVAPSAKKAASPRKQETA